MLDEYTPEGNVLNLSICSILKNEANNLQGLLKCIPLTKVEWIVLDTGSRDNTQSILKNNGIDVKNFHWNDNFSDARNASLTYATRDWILWLDGDDRLENDFWDSIKPLLKGEKKAYRFIIRSPRENSHGERFRQIRLFPNHMGIKFEGRIHEQLGTSLIKHGISAVDSDFEILHIGYDSLEKRETKRLRNLNLLEKEYLEFPDDSTVTMEYGNCLYQSGEYEKAKAIYLSLMPSASPGNCGSKPIDEILCHFPSLIGETCIKITEANTLNASSHTETTEWFQLAINWNPNEIQPYYWLGKKSLSVNNIHQALEFFYAAMDIPIVISRVANDNYTVRRNTLALIVLCEFKRFGAKKSPRLKSCLNELIAGGLHSFPLDYHVPWEYLYAAGFEIDAENYAKAYLKLFPNDISMWENYLESLFAANRYAEILGLLIENPRLNNISGVIEAFRGKCLELHGISNDTLYEIYHSALKSFPHDPTLLVYFSDFVNHNKLYERCYTDLKALPKSSETILDFLRQMETQGFGNGEVTP